VYRAMRKNPAVESCAIKVSCAVENHSCGGTKPTFSKLKIVKHFFSPKPSRRWRQLENRTLVVCPSIGGSTVEIACIVEDREPMRMSTIAARETVENLKSPCAVQVVVNSVNCSELRKLALCTVEVALLIKKKTSIST